LALALHRPIIAFEDINQLGGVDEIPVCERCPRIMPWSKG
jgi:hypothetical protein